MRILMIATLSTMLATTAVAKTPLSDVKPINDALLYVGLADEIRKNCDSISGRIFKGIARLRAIQNAAFDMGYTKAEVDAFVDSRADKDRLKARGQAYLAENGASLSEPETMCALGRQEIAENTAIGSLLFEK